MGRSKAIVGLAAVVAASALLGPSAASARAPQQFSFSYSQPGTIDCGTFQDQFMDFFDVQGAVYFDAADTPIRVVSHWEHHSNDMNSVTGFTLHEHGHFTQTEDVSTGTVTLVGSAEIMNRPGTGVVVQDVGRAVFDADNNLVFFAGNRTRNSLFVGDQLWCNALA